MHVSLSFSSFRILFAQRSGCNWRLHIGIKIWYKTVWFSGSIIFVENIRKASRSCFAKWWVTISVILTFIIMQETNFFLLILSNQLRNFCYSSTIWGTQSQHPRSPVFGSSPGQIRTVLKLGQATTKTVSDNLRSYRCLLFDRSVRCDKAMLRQGKLSIWWDLLQFDV